MPGEPEADIADALGIPVGTVKSRVFRATRLLREELARSERVTWSSFSMAAPPVWKCLVSALNAEVGVA
jgi:hypothetical protein